eukprot:4288784-Alexandrium_andersonii.AAC.1
MAVRQHPGAPSCHALQRAIHKCRAPHGTIRAKGLGAIIQPKAQQRQPARNCDTLRPTGKRHNPDQIQSYPQNAR